MPEYFQKVVTSPVGPLTLIATSTALVEVRLPSGDRDSHFYPSEGPGKCAEGSNAVLEQAERELSEYFEGERREFSTPLAPAGTAFQKSVWEALLKIPYGETRSYAGQARLAGHPRAARAVGAANGRNPLPLFIPCHRVIGADGSLTGFGGGLEVKAWLLAHEKAHSISQGR